MGWGMVIPLEKIKTGDRHLGGKAWGLGLLAAKGFPVPPGLVLDSPPTDDEWPVILKWWSAQKSAPLAIRSSAGAEDSAETSFAGQNQSFLNVESETELKAAIHRCFESVTRANSQAYRRFFAQSENGGMNVVVQQMVEPSFSGVFFSEDPRSARAGWMLEVVRGLGESLVSGQVTPGRFYENGEAVDLPAGFTKKEADEVARTGIRVAQSLNFSVDMEWAFDRNGRFYVLQARPITTATKKVDFTVIEREFKRLKENRAATTVWDGQTFAEFGGCPRPLTLSLWQKAFAPKHAFGEALRFLGYRSFPLGRGSGDESVLENLFGRAYVNLDRLTDLYYGPSPYKIELKPRPHAVFSRHKLSFRSLINFPAGTWNMFKVGWNLSTARNKYYQRCLEELSLAKSRFARPLPDPTLARQTMDQLVNAFDAEAEEFSSKTLFWPLVLVILTEATTQALRGILESLWGAEVADRKLRDWTGLGLHTVTLDMQRDLAAASTDPTKRSLFMARFGHRGPGEMDLSNPRWFELGEKAFRAGTVNREWRDHSAEIEAEIMNIKSFKREMILEEWRLLKKLLETRETWKMELLKPYAGIRLIVEEIGRRTGLNDQIHDLTGEEIVQLGKGSEAATVERLKAIAQARSEALKAYKTLSLPQYVSLNQLEKIVSGSAQETTEPTDRLEGEALSSGIGFGEIRFVSDPSKINIDEWPENVILAAESTDPGWTPLFTRAKGIIVERGGVLSHCAILSREMGIPAVGGITGVAKRLHDGDRVWVDGHHGRIVHESL